MGFRDFFKKPGITGLGLQEYARPEEEVKKNTKEDERRQGLEQLAGQGVPEAQAELGAMQRREELRQLAENGTLTDKEFDEYATERVKAVADRAVEKVVGIFKGFRSTKKGLGNILGGARRFVAEMGGGNEKSWEKSRAKQEARLNKEQEELNKYAEKVGLEDLSQVPSVRAKETILGLEPGSRAMGGEVTMGYKLFAGIRKFNQRKNEIRNLYIQETKQAEMGEKINELKRQLDEHRINGELVFDNYNEYADLQAKLGELGVEVSEKIRVAPGEFQKQKKEAQVRAFQERVQPKGEVLKVTDIGEFRRLLEEAEKLGVPLRVEFSTGGRANIPETLAA